MFNKLDYLLIMLYFRHYLLVKDKNIYIQLLMAEYQTHAKIHKIYDSHKNLTNMMDILQYFFHDGVASTRMFRTFYVYKAIFFV